MEFYATIHGSPFFPVIRPQAAVLTVRATDVSAQYHSESSSYGLLLLSDREPLIVFIATDIVGMSLDLNHADILVDGKNLNTFKTAMDDYKLRLTCLKDNLAMNLIISPCRAAALIGRIIRTGVLVIGNAISVIIELWAAILVFEAIPSSTSLDTYQQRRGYRQSHCLDLGSRRYLRNRKVLRAATINVI